MQIITHSKHGQNVSDVERAASLVAGTLLTLRGLRGRGASSYLYSIAGVELMRRGVTGRCYAYDALGISTARSSPGTSVPYPVGLRVDETVTVNRGIEDVYKFWRNFENLPKFMRHLESVTVLDDRRSRWEAKAPGGRTVQWEAEIINEVDNRLIGWRSLEGAQVQNAGSVQFHPAPGGRGTVVRVELQYNPPAGIVGAMFAKMLGEEPSQQIREDLHRFKQVMEAGEVATTEGQTSGREESTTVGP